MQRTLVEEAGRGDEEAFASLARASADRLMAIAFRILRDVGRAEDATQAALLSAWRQLPNLRDPDKFDAWLRRLLVNACYVEARRERQWTRSIRVLAVDDRSSSPDGTGDVALRDAFDRVFRRLPADQRVVFVYRHYLGFDLQEIADELAVPLGTVKSRLHYATHAMRSALAEDRDVAREPHLPSERSA